MGSDLLELKECLENLGFVRIEEIEGSVRFEDQAANPPRFGGFQGVSKAFYDPDQEIRMVGENRFEEALI